MKIRISFFILSLFAVLPFTVNAQRYAARTEYIEKYKDIAIREMKDYGIPASITLAQACLESGDGKSRLAKEANNHFGIKCHNDWTGKKIYHDDDAKGECFRVYSHAEESFKDHSVFLKYRQRYASLFDLNPKDYKAWAHGLKKAGYATNPQYAQILIKIIEEYELYKYDGEVPRSEIKLDTPRQTVETKTGVVDIDNFVVKFGREVYTNNGIKFILAKRQDTYSRIADEFGLTRQKLMAYNDLDDNATIKEGDVIFVQRKKGKASRRYPVHIVEAGETMHSISQLYGIKLSTLYKKNRMDMSRGEQPVSGQELYLRKTMKR
ncbi:MAG: glucosaminidase domain-containing protein [Prevotellaceae bacterium]|jgi:LysM repeat protein|nr:glucosaminidase domain-containing protein [Prevotellaceae bacterium]